jgi:wobble nucleotide-excising tRNase
MTLSNEARTAIARYEVHRQTIATLSHQLQQTNTSISVVKENAVIGNPIAIASDVVRLKAVKARHTTTLSALCTNYLAEKSAKTTTEQLRNQAKSALDQHRITAFPGYQTAINLYLERFNAGYRLDRVEAADSRGGPTCTYNVIINNTPVSVAGGVPTPGEPSFQNILSAGDRNTLALAFFFASLDQDQELANKVVVIDDPISSLDEHRSLTTVQELRRLGHRASQVIVLSHNKPFLCRIWEGTDSTLRAALEVARAEAGSTIRRWNVDQDSITENDRRHALLRAYLGNGTSNNREVACSIRHLIEAFLRVAYPEHFPPGTLLGSFLAICEQRVSTAQEILSNLDLQELRNLIEYANIFHHDTNPAWETELINDGQLRGFVDRAIRFARR